MKYMQEATLQRQRTTFWFSLPQDACMIQYGLRISAGLDPTTGVSGIGTGYDSVTESDARLVVQAIQKWNICQKQIRRERDNKLDIYGDNGTMDSNKICPEETNGGNYNFTETRGTVNS
ncbi:hypothetical protein LWI29_019750 [Acer saccharum]|uniref:BCAS3 domain-containing protein n=1 Tax=Acer saccharum TaxID=4024 RepID=A0AA39T2W0_ACESA|nr:hypothetical protein LWI29_019750 [Acer saccharum]